MSTEFAPPYWAWKSHNGNWYLLNFWGGCELACDCRRHAEETATEMNAQAKGPHMQKLKRMVLDFERLASEYLSSGMEKSRADRMAMEDALQLAGWSEQESLEMSENIFTMHLRKQVKQ